MQVQVDGVDLALSVGLHDTTGNLSPFLPGGYRECFGGLEKNGVWKSGLPGPPHFSVLRWTCLRNH